MDPSKVQELFRRAVASDDAVSMREGLERMLGLGEHGGLSPEREYGLRRPDFVMDMPQSRERIREAIALLPRHAWVSISMKRGASRDPAQSYRWQPCLGC